MSRKPSSAKILAAALTERTPRFENRRDLYRHGVDFERKDSVTRKRLTQIQDMGLQEVGVASFGVPDVVSGLYIEKVWNFIDEEWDGYIGWMQSVIDEKISENG